MLTDDSLDVISSEDMNILFLACLLHDSGLHITEDMFLRLTDHSNNGIAIASFDSKSWPELWTEFIAEARRFSAKKLISLFGDKEPIREPPRHALEMTQRDRLLVGEFLRRHHPRFAHEFAIGIIPDANGTRFRLGDFDPAIQDIAGLTARSHGIDLRDSLDYIQSRYDLRDYNRIHIVFLMALLRIADYLQIQSARAPELFGRLHNIRSPFSLGEWRLHQCIENITTSSLDPEAIFIAASPRSVHEYLKFQKWFKGLQRELDISWAIFGEVYGRFTREALNKLKLSIRRLRSNIEDRVTLQKRVPFVPDAISFSVADAELLKLLMQPLYGDNPVYGIRELTQNAADSVRELRQLISEGLTVESPRLATNADIELTVAADPEPSVVIKDSGTGMTLEVLKNFFLRAGASFRNSDLWKRQFEDESGRSKVARAGRFGVGALSAFLIGDRIDVYTRHFSEKSGVGLRFSATIDDDEIEITQMRGPIGTQIEIASNQEQIRKIARYFGKPRGAPFFFNSTDLTLRISVDDSLTSATTFQAEWERERAITIDEAIELPPRWISTTNAQYDRVEWDRTKHTINWGEATGYLFCNGILVGDLARPQTDLIVRSPISQIGNTWRVTAPTVSIMDNDGILPLDLARKSFVRYDKELGECIVKSMWTELISSFFYSRHSSASELVNFWRRGDFLFSSSWVPIIFGKTGWTFLDEIRLHALNPKRLIVLPPNEEAIDDIFKHNFISDKTFLLMKGHGYSASRTDTLYKIREPRYYILPNFQEDSLKRKQYFSNIYSVYDKETLEGAINLKKAPKYLRSSIFDESRVFKVGNRAVAIVSTSSLLNGKEMLEFTKFVSDRYSKYPAQIAQDLSLASEYSNPDPKKTALSEVWDNSFVADLIPYDPKARAAILKADAPIRAFEKRQTVEKPTS
jgi:molecular chaperone HtpG